MIKTPEWTRGITEDRRERGDARKMDGYPVLQIVRCRLGTEMEMDSQGYPFPMATHSHSHLPHPANHAHFPRPHYPHPCGTPRDPFRLSASPFCAPFVHSLLIDTASWGKVKGCDTSLHQCVHSARCIFIAFNLRLKIVSWKLFLMIASMLERKQM